MILQNRENEFSEAEWKDLKNDLYGGPQLFVYEMGVSFWNSLSYDMMDGYALNELLEKIPNSFTISEEPLTSPNNCIIVWGTKKDIL